MFVANLIVRVPNLDNTTCTKWGLKQVLQHEGRKGQSCALAARRAPACGAVGMLSGYSGKTTANMERRDRREPGRRICSLFSTVTRMFYPHVSPGSNFRSKAVTWI